MSILDECWEWNGARSRHGYGLKANGRGGSNLTHRLAYAWAWGPIPDGLFVCHRCDNPPCCNPAHLFLGTASDNARDMCEKRRHQAQQRTHCPAGHELTEYREGGHRACLPCRRESKKLAVARWRRRQTERKPVDFDDLPA